MSLTYVLGLVVVAQISMTRDKLAAHGAVLSTMGAIKGYIWLI